MLLLEGTLPLVLSLNGRISPWSCRLRGARSAILVECTTEKPIEKGRPIYIKISADYMQESGCWFSLDRVPLSSCRCPQCFKGTLLCPCGVRTQRMRAPDLPVKTKFKVLLGEASVRIDSLSRDGTSGRLEAGCFIMPLPIRHLSRRLPTHGCIKVSYKPI